MDELEIKEDPEKLQAFCKMIDKRGMGHEMYLISSGLYNDAYLAVSPTGASSIALKVNITGGIFNNHALKLVNVHKYFVKTIKESGSVTIKIPFGFDKTGTQTYSDYYLLDSNGNSVDVPLSHYTWDLGFPLMSNTAKAFTGTLCKVGKIRLPNRIGRDKGAVFDLKNHRYGVCKVHSTEFNYLFSEVRDLDVEYGTVVTCYYGNVAAKLPWKRGLEAELFMYPPQYWKMDQYMLRYEIDGVVILLMPVNPDSNQEHYMGVFGEELSN